MSVRPLKEITTEIKTCVKPVKNPKELNEEVIWKNVEMYLKLCYELRPAVQIEQNKRDNATKHINVLSVQVLKMENVLKVPQLSKGQ